MNNIPCTVAILTKNSAKTLERALDGVKDFSDIIVCDGGSTDGTLDIVHRYGARVIPQDARYLDAEGRINDFSGVRNQTLSAAKEEWFLFLDADEYVLSEFAEEVRKAASAEPRAYWVPRRYVVGGVVIQRSIGYPNRQMRLFHRSLVEGFRKQVHEKVVLRPGAAPAFFPEAVLVPSDTPLPQQREKNERYAALELRRIAPLTPRKRLAIIRGALRTMLLYALRELRLLLPPYKGARMPLRQDMEAFRYQLLLVRKALT